MCLKIKSKLRSLISPTTLIQPAESGNADFCKELMDILEDAEQRDIATQQRIAYNFCYCVRLIQADLKEIDVRINEMKTAISKRQLSDENYEKKKLLYFIKLNEAAKEEIITFFSEKLIDFILSKPQADFRHPREQSLDALDLASRYDYAKNRRFYDQNYDFSTETKIRFLPGVDKLLPDDDIREFIELKQKDFASFNAEIDRIVSENNVIAYIADAIRNRYVFYKRAEIFDTLVELYRSGKFSSFIALIMMQIEGIFYDCITVKYQKERFDKAGTLVEKAKAAFSTNDIVMKAIFPYFAFEFPVMRNQVAHSGMLISEDLRHTSNELILDLYCVIFWTCKLSDEKYISLRMVFNKLHETKNDEDNAGILFRELFATLMVSSNECLDVLATPEKYDDELMFYEKSVDKSVGKVTIKAVVDKLSGLIKSEAFWKYAHNSMQYITEPRQGDIFNLIDYLFVLKNKFIAVLPNGSPEKTYCAKINAALATFNRGESE